MLNIIYTKKFLKGYAKMPQSIQNKFDKQIKFLVEDFQHPSLHTKKVQGKTDIWEVRIDLFYRFTFSLEGESATMRTIGPHDEALK